MSYQRSGEISGERNRVAGANLDPKVKQAKQAINEDIKQHKYKLSGALGGSSLGGSGLYSSWSSLPQLWRYALFMDVLAFGIPGLLCLFYPTKALDYHRTFAHYFNWAGPSPGVASNVLLLFVQMVGTLCTSLALLCAWGAFVRSVDFARGWAIFRLALSLGLLYISVLQPSGSWLGTLSRPFLKMLGMSDPYSTGSTSYKFALLPFAHSMLQTSLLAMSPEFLSGLLNRARDEISHLA